MQGRRQRGDEGDASPHLTRWGDGMYNHPPPQVLGNDICLLNKS